MSPPILDKLLQAMQGAKGVPASERAVASVLGALDSSLESRHAVVRHIVEDFALTQKVLRLANSSMYAPFGGGSASVSSALEVLGSEAVLHLVLGADLVSEEELQKDDNLSRTLLASELARHACAARAEDASIAALMVEIGRLMCAKYLPTENAEIAHRVADGQAPAPAVAAVLGLSYQELGVQLANRWNLPDSIRATMDGSGDPLLVGIARFASTASGLIHDGQGENVAALLQQLDLPGVDKSRLGALMRHKVDEARTRQRAAAPAAPAAPVTPASATEGLLALHHALQAEKKHSLEELANALLPVLADCLETAHCLLFMLTRTGEQRVRNGYGKGIDELKSRLKIGAEFSPTAFHAAIKNNSDVSIADVSKLKDASLPEGYRALLPHVTKFLILPVATGRVCGLLYCDWDSSRTLKQSELEALKKLRDLLPPYFPQ